MSFTFPTLPQQVTPDEIGTIVNTEIQDLVDQWRSLMASGMMPDFEHNFRDLEEAQQKTLITHSFRSVGVEFSVQVQYQATPQAQVDRLWVVRTPPYPVGGLEVPEKVMRSYGADMMTMAEAGQSIMRKKPWFQGAFHDALQDMLNAFGDYRLPKKPEEMNDPDDTQQLDPLRMPERPEDTPPSS